MEQDTNTWSAYLSRKWDVEITTNHEQDEDLERLFHAIGRVEFDECVDIVANANEHSRSVRYLIGVINRRRDGSARRTGPVNASPVKKQPAASLHVYVRCEQCQFVNRVRRDVMNANRSKVMKCGGVECTNQWPVNELMQRNERVE